MNKIDKEYIISKFELIISINPDVELDELIFNTINQVMSRFIIVVGNIHLPTYKKYSRFAKVLFTHYIKNHLSKTEEDIDYRKKYYHYDYLTYGSYLEYTISHSASHVPMYSALYKYKDSLTLDDIIFELDKVIKCTVRNLYTNKDYEYAKPFLYRALFKSCIYQGHSFCTKEGEPLKITEEGKIFEQKLISFYENEFTFIGLGKYSDNRVMTAKYRAKYLI